MGMAAFAAPAAAAPLALAMPAAMPLVAVGANQVHCSPALPAAADVAAVTATVALGRGGTMSKSAAILGGQPSALERIRMQQNAGSAVSASAGAAPLVPALPAASVAVPLSAVGFTCASPRAVEAAPVAAPSPRIEVASAPTGSFLGTERVKIGKTRFDAQWNRVAARGLSARDLAGAIGAKPESRAQLLSRVNRWVNHAIRYKSDARGDSWADARTTLRTRAGDCEDYAILKMQLLAAGGVAADDMMLTLARDNLRRIDHAVLLVKQGSDWVMLDMQTDRVMPAARDYGYRPVMSFAGKTRYLHGQRYEAPAEPVRIARAD